MLIFVGYRLKTRASLIMPTFAPHGSCKSEEAKQDSIRKKEQEFVEGLATVTPFCGELAEVYMVAPLALDSPPAKRAKHWAPSPEGRAFKKPIGALVKDWILGHYPNVWATSPAERNDQDPTFIGFDPKTFLKFVGYESAEADEPAPSGLWYANSNHRDVTGMLIPTEDRSVLSLDIPLLRLGLAEHPQDSLTHLTPYDYFLQTGRVPLPYTPGEHPAMDAGVALHVAAKLGFVKSEALQAVARVTAPEDAPAKPKKEKAAKA